jgi:hypothetical protein
MNSQTQLTDTSTRKTKRVYWRHHIDEWNKSGITQVQYCQENQLNKHNFIYWKSKLEKRNTFPPLLPVTVRPDVKRPRSSFPSGIALSFNDRFSVQLEVGFNCDTLSRLIDMLETQ